MKIFTLEKSDSLHKGYERFFDDMRASGESQIVAVILNSEKAKTQREFCEKQGVRVIILGRKPLPLPR